MPEKRNSSLKIAVIDDSDFSRQAIAQILEEEGYRVVCSANNAEEGLAKGKLEEANLYLIDIVMPRRSGLEVAKLISDKSQNTKIITMSSLNSEQVIIESLSSGATDFLQKPFDAVDLIKAVEKAESELE